MPSPTWGGQRQFGYRENRNDFRAGEAFDDPAEAKQSEKGSDDMTLGEGKKKVLMLIDEYSSGGALTVDEDIERKMTAFFDQAQKQVSRLKRVVKLHRIERQPGVTEYAMPKDFLSVLRIWRNGVESMKYNWKAGKLVIPDEDKAVIEVEYSACPATIPDDADDDYEFEVAEDAAEAMPYFVAAQQLVVDLVVDYGALLQLYQMALSGIDNRGAGIKLRNTLYR